MNVPCPDCFTGTLRGDVVPRGREEILYGLPTYVTGPEPGIRPLGTVVIIPDAFGWRLLNTRALADVYAQRVPCIVYVPDFMNDHSPPQKFMILSEAKPPANSSLLRRVFSGLWTTIRVLPLLLSFAIHNRPSKVKPRIQSFIRSVRGTTISPAQSSPTPLAVAGFCWGGPYTVRLTHDIPENKVLFNPGGIPGVSKGVEVHVIDCAFTAHPSLLEVPGDIEKVVWPLSIADGDNDEWLGGKKWEQVVKTLESKNRYWGERSQQTEGGPIEDLHQAKVYPGAKHGFAVRGDRDDPMQRERGWRSEDQAVRWFRRHFGEQAHGQGAASISSGDESGDWIWPVTNAVA
ncbi:protein AIM2 [Rhypophila decipiens]